MGREVKRVALDFSWELNKVWKGFLNPHYSHCHNCKSCNGTGYSPEAKNMQDEWYGYVDFDPTSTGSEPFAINHPKIWRLATRNATSMLKVSYDNFRFPTDEEIKDVEENHYHAIEQEANRLCRVCYNNHWSHHLSQEDVDALWEHGRLTHDFKEKLTAAEVNEWAIGGMNHDSINSWICIEARCEREGVEKICSVCNGEGSIWESEEWERKAEEWESEEPPEGPGYQIWETVSEGSPVSPVFEDPEDLARWMVNNDTTVTKDTTFDQWVEFIENVKWAPSFIGSSKGIKSGTAMVDVKS